MSAVSAAAAPDGAAAQASGSSFYAAMRVLPRERREAMFAIYGFCRQVDDIADEPGGSAPAQRAALAAWRADIEALYAGAALERCASLAAAIAAFGLQKGDFLAVIDGMEMDVGAPIVAPDFATLDLYCDRVASAVGRLSVRVFGMPAEPGGLIAHHLGRALQFTNILRDLDEDAAMGRLYLPREALDAAGITTRAPAAVLADPRLDLAGRWLARKAHAHYQAANALMKRQRRRARRAPRLMAAVYGDILTRMERAGWAAPRRRVRLDKRRLAALAARHGLIG